MCVNTAMTNSDMKGQIGKRKTRPLLQQRK